MSLEGKQFKTDLQVETNLISKFVWQIYEWYRANYGLIKAFNETAVQ